MTNKIQQRLRQTTAALVALALVLSVLGPVGVVVAAPGVTVSHAQNSVTAAPGDEVQITVEFTQTEANAPAMVPSLPDGWTITATTAANGWDYVAAQTTFLGGITLSDMDGVTGTYTHTYTVLVPSDAAPGDYTVTSEGSVIEPATSNRLTSTDSTTITVEEPVVNPANFQVSNLNPTDVTVTQGDVIDVSATVENTGDEAGTQSVSFQVDGTALTSQDVTLAAGASQTVTFEDIDTSTLAPGDYTHGVYTSDDSQTATLSVDPAPAVKSTDVSLSPTDAEITLGNTGTYDIVVENTDGGVGAFTATVTVDDPSVAIITDVEVQGSPGLLETDYASDNSSVTINAALADTANTGSVTIATIEVTGQGEGTANLGLDVAALGDENGNSYTVDSTSGATVTAVDLAPIGNFQNSPNDLNGDGLYEDTNGDGVFNIVDIQATFANINDPVIQNNPEKFNYNGDATFDIVDVQAQYYLLINGGA
ncbi:hypothetical protein SAMN04487949_1980 [Halogranum gelatinilyticum]|uniref:CARDB protein n=1 Tax=Halogranum gelatinilyticum TaxID=660521 RepID=A0A1G9TZR4_9EURY|nr:hypothetical protein [Halogranum gelatinilyticum]SDM53166.1 hypothetical protein SAMN04487949_1980 [Halogranum gelatinilyticum]